LAFAAACAMHPLIALPAMMIGLGVLLRTRVWLGLMGAGVLLALGLGVMGVAPFTGLLQPMDALWFELAVTRSPFVFLHAWEWRGFSQALFVVVVTGAAWRILTVGELRRLAWVTLVCVLGAFAIAYVGASLIKLPLIVGLQLTRVMWIGLVIALILIVAMLWESRQGNVWNQMLALGLALGVFVGAGTQGGYALLVIAIFWLGKRRLPDCKPPVWLWWPWLLLGLLPLQIMLWSLLIARMGAVEDPLTWQAIWRIYFTVPATALVLVSGAYWLPGRDSLPKPLKWAGGTVVAGLLGLAMLAWYDLKPQLNYDSPERQAAIAHIAARVPQDATVYWVEEPEKAWFWLGRANYLSFSQGAGSIFSRGTVLEAQRRAEYVRPASQQDANQAWDKQLLAPPAKSISMPALRQVCRDPILDFVIARSQTGAGGGYFKDPQTGLGYGLYDCRAIRVPDNSGPITNALDVKGQDKMY
jgi:hypothetical protein